MITKSANRYQFKKKENWSLHIIEFGCNTEFRFTQWTSLFKELGLYVVAKLKRVKNKAHFVCQVSSIFAVSRYARVSAPDLTS